MYVCMYVCTYTCICVGLKRDWIHESLVSSFCRSDFTEKKGHFQLELIDLIDLDDLDAEGIIEARQWQVSASSVQESGF